jgi:hypothetical protein
MKRNRHLSSTDSTKGIWENLKEENVQEFKVLE